VKDPDIAPLETAQTGFEINPARDEVIVHPISPAAKFEPVTNTFVPVPPEAGISVIPGSTRKVAVPLSFGVAGPPITKMV